MGEMSEELKILRDSEKIARVVEKMFIQSTLLLMEEDDEYPVSVVGYEQPKLRIRHDRPEGRSRALFLDHADYDVFLNCRVVERAPENEEIVEPETLEFRRPKQIRSKQIRQQIQSKQGRQEQGIQEQARPVKTVEFQVHNCVAFKDFPVYLGDKRYIEHQNTLLKKYTERLNKIAPVVNLHIRRSTLMDNRLKLLSRLRRPIFAPSFSSSFDWDFGRFVHFNEFRKFMNVERPPEGIVAEITEPVSYRNIYLYGYVLVQFENEIEIALYDEVSGIARDLQRDFEKGGLLPRNPEICDLTDIRRNGVDFLHPDNYKIMQSFIPGDYIILDIRFPAGNEGAFSGVIRNIKSLEKSHRFSVDFSDLTDEQKELLERYM